MATPPQPPRQRVVDNPDIRETYSDKLVGATFAGGAMVVTLGCARFIAERPEPQAPTEGVVSVNNRIALSPQLAVDLINALTQLINAANTAQQQAAAAAAKPPGESGAAKPQ